MAKDQLKPRLCHMLKGENGYGFHLHGEKGKSGQFIRKVEPGSPAEAAGLRAGDRVVEVNGINVEQETHHQSDECVDQIVAFINLPGAGGARMLMGRVQQSGESLCFCSLLSPLQVVQRIKAVESETRLLVVDKETDEYLCSLRLTCTEEMAHSGILLGSGISPSKSVGSDNGEVWKPQLELSVGSLQRHSHSFSSHGSRKVRWSWWHNVGLDSRMCPVASKSMCGFGDLGMPQSCG
ncbi:UNVERIFIED_CONTAM: hypothetical protein H355_015073 [Colinus virginianus]|nr:hypothetical protein H355_015073 [Colinus virginianus]